MAQDDDNMFMFNRKTSTSHFQRLPPDAPVFTKEKSVSQLRLNHANEKPGKLSKSEKKSKQQNEELPQLPPAEAAFLPDFPLCGDLEELDFEVGGVILDF